MVPKNFAWLAEKSGKSAQELEVVDARYPFAMTRFLRQRILEGSYSVEAQRQFVPDIQELQGEVNFSTDPTNESGDRHGKAAIHTYENRLLIQLTNRCLAYCRFCFRKAFVGFPEHEISEEDLEQALAYLEDHPEIEDVIFSGGDPLALPNRRVLPVLKRLRRFRHLKAIRIDSRVLTTHPQRIDSELVDCLREDGRYWFYAHMNHPDDINYPETIAAIQRLVNAGVQVANQCVILAGVNDQPSVMSQLMTSCYQNKVWCYNMYIPDHVQGTEHFDVSSACIAAICKALLRLPGPAQPALVYVDEQNKKHHSRYDDIAELWHFLKNREDFLERQRQMVSSASD
jgi:KamA family protein